MGWFDSFFQGLSDLVGSSSPSVADAATGGTTDLGALAASTPSFADNAGSWLGSAAGSVADSVSKMGGDWGFGGFGGGGVDSANPTMFDPNSVGPPPSPVDTIGSVSPTQGGSVAGTFAGSGGDSVDPEALLREGQTTNPWNPSTQSSVGSTVQPAPVPTAWESVQQAPGKWWQSAANEFNRAPINTSLKVGTGLASIGLPIAAAAMAPSPPKMPSYAPIAPKPLPGTTGTGRSSIPAASPMSPNLTGSSSGGFKVGSNQGLNKKKSGAI